MTRTVAILTGDLIRSTEASPEAVDSAMGVIRDCAARIGPRTDFTRFRGDGWQLRLENPGDHLWACLLILARLRAQEGIPGCRIAVGIGAENPTDTRDLSTALGPAFTASGRALDQMKPDRLLALDGAGIDAFRRLAYQVAGELVGRWTTGQAEALALKLDPDSPADERLSNEAIARKLGITRQAVDARLKAADYPILDDMMQAFIDDSLPRGRTKDD
ncbi:MAG: hypothetical protein JNK19_15655 [Tabrizicola sp.]|nr:hypothetical protein [Tabrizicola sp.]